MVNMVIWGGFWKWFGSPSHHGCFNTKSWSNDLYDLGAPPWLRKAPYNAIHISIMNLREFQNASCFWDAAYAKETIWDGDLTEAPPYRWIGHGFRAVSHRYGILRKLSSSRRYSGMPAFKCLIPMATTKPVKRSDGMFFVLPELTWEVQFRKLKAHPCFQRMCLVIIYSFVPHSTWV